MTPGKILFIYDSKIEAARDFVESLRKSLSDFEIQLTPPGVSASLQARKYSVVHIFAPATSRNASFVKKITSKTRTIHTVLAAPTQSELERLIFGQTFVVFTKQDEAQIKQS